MFFQKLPCPTGRPETNRRNDSFTLFLFISFPAGWATRPVAQDDQKVAQDAFPLLQDDEKYAQDGFPLRRTVKSIRRTASPLRRTAKNSAGPQIRFVLAHYSLINLSVFNF